MPFRKCSLRVCIVGTGKVGRSFYTALQAARVQTQLVSSRSFFKSQTLAHTSVFILAVRDRALQEVAERLVQSRSFPSSAVVVHCSGALDASVLNPIRPYCVGVAQMHPMISFANGYHAPSFRGAHVHAQGDQEALRRIKKLCRIVGLVPRTFSNLDCILYHAAAGLVANGAAALAAAGASLLEQAGVRPDAIPLMLGPLLRSVAENVATLGLPYALTGPIRRGDAQAIAQHIALLKSKSPNLVSLYIESAKAQLPMARVLNEGSAEQYDQIQKILTLTIET